LGQCVNHKEDKLRNLSGNRRRKGGANTENLKTAKALPIGGEAQGNASFTEGRRGERVAA